MSQCSPKPASLAEKFAYVGQALASYHEEMVALLNLGDPQAEFFMKAHEELTDLLVSGRVQIYPLSELQAEYPLLDVDTEAEA